MYSLDVYTEAFRIWIPKKNQGDLKNNFLSVMLTKNDKKKSFVAKLNADGRIVIPKETRDYLSLEPKNRISVIIKKIDNLKRKATFMKNRKFDMLSFVPKFTLSGFPLLAKENFKTIYLWYSTKGRPRDVTINRFLPYAFSRFLGYYQAEGAKLKLVKRRGRTLSITNKRISFIKDVIKLSYFLFKTELWNAAIRYNPSADKKEIEEVKKELIKLGISKSCIKTKTAAKISKYTITLWISNSALAETVFNMMNVTREKIANMDGKICSYFLQGLLAGDGCFASYRDKKGSLHSKIQLFELNQIYAEDYRNLLEIFGIYGKVKKQKGKNMYVFTSYTGWETLLKLYNSGLLKYTIHQDKLISTIRSHKRYRSLRYFLFLPDKIPRSISLNGKGKAYRNTWLRDRTNEGALKRIKEGDRDFWLITEKGRFFRETLKNLDHIPI